MTKEELLTRSVAWLELPDNQKLVEANRVELNTLYHAITGKVADCTTCSNWLIRMAAKLRVFVASPELFTVQPTYSQIMANRSTKYRPSKEAIANNVDVVVMNHDGMPEAIKLSEMTDEQAERILANDRFRHNVELIPSESSDSEDQEEAPKLTEKQQLQARYKELTGEAPENSVTIAELKAQIAELEESGKE